MTEMPDNPVKRLWPAWMAGIGRYHLIVFMGCWLGGIFDGMDSTLMSVAMPLALGNLLGTTDKTIIGPIASYVTSIFLLGWVAGGILFGLMGDKLGRVRSMTISILLYALFTGLAALAHTWPELAACRFLTGLGIGGELVSISTFLTEIWPSRSRAIAVGVLITSYQTGVLIAGLLNTWIHDWRTIFCLGALPAILVIFIRLTMKESPQWEATQNLATPQAAKNQTPQSDDLSQSSLNPTSGSSQQPIENDFFGYLKTLFQRRYVKALVLGSLMFGGLNLGYWTSCVWIPLWVQDILHSGGIGNERGLVVVTEGIGAIAGCVMAGFIANWIGRPRTILLSSAGCFLTSALLFLTHSFFSSIIYGEAMLLGWFVGLTQAAMYIYLPELFPTRVRATGTGFCLNVGRCVTVITVFFVGAVIQWVAKANLGALWFKNPMLSAYGIAAFIFSAAYILSVFGALFGDETRGKALPD